MSKQGKPSTGMADGGFRQAMAWLHTWCGLWFSWLLFAIFLTGTLAVFAEPITHWMSPEHRAEEAAEEAAHAAQAAKPTAPDPAAASRGQRLEWAVAYMAQHHPKASMWELWPADAKGGGGLTAYWFDENRQYASARLDPASGRPLPAEAADAHRATVGGHHFVDFHYQLHAGNVGLWIVGVAAMAMLVALVSGVITHKRIFKDFFTFRPAKGQRSWLDAHNAVAVLTLPFQFMIAYTGLVISGLTFMPAAGLVHFGLGAEAREQFIEQIGNPGKPAPSGTAMALPALEPFAARGERLMGQPVRAVVIDHPGDAAARISVYGWNDEAEALHRLSPSSGMASFEAASGRLLELRRPGSVAGGTAPLAQSVMGSLHMASYGGWAVKWLYFLAGLAGTAMMATGAILFTVKRRGRHTGAFGASSARVYRLIESLNVAAIAGLSIACIGLLWANRLLPVALESRTGWELRIFFGLWLLALAHALLRPRFDAWREQLWALAALCLLLPALDGLSTGDWPWTQWMRGDLESLGVATAALLLGVGAASIATRSHPP
ncbi:PepSY-associated TM helix domain-containing protein [Variovorax sp. J22P168]|uniref:PepSY-associated TM helix domain-containing protein n=1 Tax=Variovorax jilinensis TaxID=3053513 RepID=UPI0025758822|nr:PepSY-associated TM helix domain-containing protein [Variovorax sp. J22P168]MDM0014727.1 PepSY-associated TM helix domain-containing protein [Variovorax sp. J22P168]